MRTRVCLPPSQIHSEMGVSIKGASAQIDDALLTAPGAPPALELRDREGWGNHFHPARL